MEPSLLHPTVLPPSFAQPFLVMNENHLAHTALNLLIGAKHANVVYLYGPSGVGKSHLVTHHLRDLLKCHTGLSHRHLQASEFHSLFVEAAQNNAIATLQEQLRCCELLICEDIQALDRKLQTQQQLLNLLDCIVSHAGHVVVTTNRMPGDFSSLLPRLGNRFHGAVCAEVRLPALTSRIALLQYFAQANQVPLTDRIVQFLADSLQVSPRELLGVVLRIDAAARIQKSPIDIQFVKRLVKHEPTRPATSVSQIARAVARIFGVSLRDIRSAARTQDVILSRQCAMFLARRLTAKTYAEIAAFFGRSHTCVVHAYKRVDDLRCQNAAIGRSLIQIEKALRSG